MTALLVERSWGAFASRRAVGRQLITPVVAGPAIAFVDCVRTPTRAAFTEAQTEVARYFTSVHRRHLGNRSPASPGSAAFLLAKLRAAVEPGSQSCVCVSASIVLLAAAPVSGRHSSASAISRATSSLVSSASSGVVLVIWLPRRVSTVG